METLEQVSPILVFLLLVLLNGGKAFSCLRLPLSVLVKLVLDVMLLSPRWSSAYCRDRGAPSVAHDSPWAGHGSHRQRRTYVFPDGHLRLLHMAATNSSQSCHPAIAHLSPDARSSQRTEERATPNQHAWAGECETIPTQHARAGTCWKILASSSLHNW